MPYRNLEPWLLNKASTLTLLGFALGPYVHLVETYLFADWQFLKFLLILILLDTALGLYRAWGEKELSSRAFAAFFQKLLVYTSFLVLVHVLGHFTVDGVKNGLFSWLSSVAYAGIMVREGLSILENLALINPSLLPTWLIERLQGFDKTGKMPL